MDFYDEPEKLKENATVISLEQTYVIEMKCGRRLLEILGLLTAFTCTVILLLKDRKIVTTSGSILIVLLSLFIVFSVMFVVSSVLLLLATFESNVNLMTEYIWQCLAYLCLQLILALTVPVVLVWDDRPLPSVTLTWLVIVLMVGLGWTHFVATVESYRMDVISSLH